MRSEFLDAVVLLPFQRYTIQLFLSCVLLCPFVADAKQSAYDRFFDGPEISFQSCKSVRRADYSAKGDYHQLGARFLGTINQRVHQLMSNKLQDTRYVLSCLPLIRNLHSQGKMEDRNGTSVLKVSAGPELSKCLPVLALYNELTLAIERRYPDFQRAMFFMTEVSTAGTNTPYYRRAPMRMHHYFSGMKTPAMIQEKRTIDGEKLPGRTIFHAIYRRELADKINSWRQEFVSKEGLNCFDRATKMKNYSRCQILLERDFPRFANQKRRALQISAQKTYMQMLAELPMLGRVQSWHPGFDGIEQAFADSAENLQDAIANGVKRSDADEWYNLILDLAFVPVVNTIINELGGRDKRMACALLDELRVDYREAASLWYAVKKLDWRTKSILAGIGGCLVIGGITGTLPAIWPYCLTVGGIAEGWAISYDGVRRYDDWFAAKFSEIDRVMVEGEGEASTMASLADGADSATYLRSTWALFPVLVFGDIIIAKPLLRIGKPSFGLLLVLLKGDEMVVEVEVRPEFVHKENHFHSSNPDPFAPFYFD